MWYHFWQCLCAKMHQCPAITMGSIVNKSRSSQKMCQAIFIEMVTGCISISILVFEEEV